MWSKFIDLMVDVSWLSWWVTTKSPHRITEFSTRLKTSEGNGSPTGQRNHPRIGSGRMHRKLRNSRIMRPFFQFMHTDTHHWSSSFHLGLWFVCETVCKLEVKLESTLHGNRGSKLGRLVHHLTLDPSNPHDLLRFLTFPPVFFFMCFGVASWRDLSMSHLVILRRLVQWMMGPAEEFQN